MPAARTAVLAAALAAAATAGRSSLLLHLGSTSDQAPSAIGEEANIKRCTCDCCLAQQARGSASGTAGLECSPLSGPGIAEQSAAAAASIDHECAAQEACAARDGLLRAFDARGSAVDYARFCLQACRPINVDLLCVTTAAPARPAVPRRPSQLAVASSTATAMGASVRTAEKAQMSPAAQSSAILLAKGAMLEAKLEAQAAGKAAMIAKESFEEVMRSSTYTASEASTATLDQVKREAGEQSKEALLIRLKYEENAKQAAIKKAIAAAQIYKDALTRDQTIAGTWQLRATEYATAAAQRKHMAMEFGAQAGKYRADSDWSSAREYIVQAHQAMDQAGDFARKSKAAHEQANAVQAGNSWYIYAEQAAAANMLAKSMPPDVPPPDMPKLP